VIPPLVLEVWKVHARVVRFFVAPEGDAGGVACAAGLVDGSSPFPLGLEVPGKAGFWRGKSGEDTIGSSSLPP
jgi:hypothetical protein